MNEKVIKQNIILLFIAIIIIVFLATYNVNAADVTMTTDPSDFYWNTALGNEGSGVIEYEGEIYWCNRANLAVSDTYRYDNVGWWVQLTSASGSELSFLIYEEDSLINEENIDGYGYYLFKISRSTLIEKVESSGYSAIDFFKSKVSVELDGYVQVVNVSGNVVAGPYDLRSDTAYNTLIIKLENYEFGDNSIYTITYELRDKILNIDGEDVLLEYSIVFNTGTTEKVENMPNNEVKYYGITYVFPTTIPTRVGYAFKYWLCDDYGYIRYPSTGTLTYNKDRSFTAVWEILTYSNSLECYATGFLEGEGTNGEQFLLYTEQWEQEYGTIYEFDGGILQEIIPNGYYLSDEEQVLVQFSDDTSENYNIPFELTQFLNSYSILTYYEPYEYEITYDLGGGELEEDLVGSYTVLYGVSFESEPTYEKHSFVGWMIDEEIVTGINEGAGASFADAEDLYTQLEQRQVGDVIVTAEWDAYPELEATDVYMYLKNDIEEERFYENVLAIDEEDGDIIDKVSFNKEELEDKLENLRAEEITEDVEYQLEIIYTVQDSFGNEVTTTAILHVYEIYDDSYEAGIQEAGYIRFISEEYIDTLEENSYWRTVEMYAYLEGVL